MSNAEFVSADIEKWERFENESHEAVNEFISIKEEFDRINNTLLNSWQGMGANAYRSETAHILEKIGGIEDVLKSINESVIKDIRDAYNNLDNELGEFNTNPDSSDAK